MALILCPECNKEVSSKAYQCPNCGMPIVTHLLKQDVKRSIGKTALTIMDTARVSCKECGYIAGVVNLEGGLCEKCRSGKVVKLRSQVKAYTNGEIIVGLFKFSIIVGLIIGINMFLN